VPLLITYYLIASLPTPVPLLPRSSNEQQKADGRRGGGVGLGTGGVGGEYGTRPAVLLAKRTRERERERERERGRVLSPFRSRAALDRAIVQLRRNALSLWRQRSAMMAPRDLAITQKSILIPPPSLSPSPLAPFGSPRMRPVADGRRSNVESRCPELAAIVRRRASRAR